MSQLEKEVYNEFQSYKIKLNKNAVRLDEEISKGAKLHSTNMFNSNDLYHDNIEVLPVKSEICQYSFKVSDDLKENAKFILEGFLISQSHKKLLEEKSDLMGVGIYVDEETDTYWVTIRFR
jgi:uncharacterized protein YkwD